MAVHGVQSPEIIRKSNSNTTTCGKVLADCT